MKLMTVMVTLATAIGGAYTDRTPLIEQALDQIMQFEIADTPVLEAFEAITAETGVTISATAELIDLLPYGRDTQISVVLKNLSLREGMARLLLPLGMTFEVSGEGVRVLPRAALLRIGRRATWAELDGLAYVRQADWPTLTQDSIALGQRVQFRVKVEDPRSLLATAAARIGAGPGDQVLTLACESLGWTWFPEGERIVILPEEKQVRRQLEREVSMRCTHRPLIEVLQQLSRRTNLPIGHEPGVLASLPIQTRQNFSLLVEGITAAETLEQIAAGTGLGYRIDGTTVVFYHPGGTAAELSQRTRAKATARDPYVAKLALPAESGEVQVEILIRQSELSPEAIEARRQLVRKADEILRLHLNEQATQKQGDEETRE